MRRRDIQLPVAADSGKRVGFLFDRRSRSIDGVVLKIVAPRCTRSTARKESNPIEQFSNEESV